jgi:hypothetical protein
MSYSSGIIHAHLALAGTGRVLESSFQPEPNHMEESNIDLIEISFTRFHFNIDPTTAGAERRTEDTILLGQISKLPKQLSPDDEGMMKKLWKVHIFAFV